MHVAGDPVFPPHTLAAFFVIRTQEKVMPTRQRIAGTVELVDAAAKLHVPYHTAHRWVLVGRLKGARVDGAWTVDAADLDRLIRERDSAAAPQAAS